MPYHKGRLKNLQTAFAFYAAMCIHAYDDAAKARRA